ncbi:cupin domain-containing protein [Nocardia halotolerans]|uniref:Cupin domain-containing protein n=1 Tax=Nocardia halotolerans TaxID=1755878 RepID=A0ABV8VNG4_9NOCA
MVYLGRGCREQQGEFAGGVLRLAIDGQIASLRPGDAAVAPAGATIALTNPGAEPAVLLVTVRVGFSAELSDGATFVPPWAM